MRGKVSGEGAADSNALCRAGSSQCWAAEKQER